MRICIIADQIYKAGGIERVLSHRVNHWVNQGYEVHLITSENRNNRAYYFYDSRLIHHDIQGDFNKSITLFSPYNLKLACRYFFKLKAVIKSINPSQRLVCLLRKKL